MKRIRFHKDGEGREKTNIFLMGTKMVQLERLITGEIFVVDISTNKVLKSFFEDTRAKTLKATKSFFKANGVKFEDEIRKAVKL